MELSQPLIARFRSQFPSCSLPVINSPRNHPGSRLLAGLVISCLLASAHARSVSPASATAKPASETAQLSAFEVTSDTDEGYSSSHTIGATRTDTPLNEFPQAISVINQQYIRGWLPDNIDAAGKYVAGVTDAPTQLFRGRRSISPAIDGLGTEDVYDMSMFERVEFLKGPSSIIYGDGNKTGVISRASKKPL